LAMKEKGESAPGVRWKGVDDRLRKRAGFRNRATVKKQLHT
jgi:hypothetical protein